MVLYQAMLLKNLFVISLILLISISHFGYYFVCSYQQKKVRKEMKLRMLANINSTSLVVFEKALIDPEIIWKEKGKEFILKGEMFDIVSITKNAGKTYFHCINDKVEKKMLNDFASKIGNQASGSAKGKKSLNQIKFQLQDIVLIDLKEAYIFHASLSHHYYTADEALIFTSKKVSLPPPRC